MDVLVEVQQPFDDGGAASQLPRGDDRRRRRGGGGWSLTLAALLAYTQMKASLIYGDLAVGAVVPVYLEVFGLNIGSLAIVRALAKSIDFLVAFAIGFLSDTWRSLWGRRLPFILFGSVFAPISLWALASPPPELTLAGALAPTARRRLVSAPAPPAQRWLLPSAVADAVAAGGATSGTVGSIDAAGGHRALLASFRPFADVCSSEALEAAASIGYPPVIWRGLSLSAELARRAGDRSRADRDAARARRLVEDLAQHISDPELRRGFGSLGERLDVDWAGAYR